MSIFHSWSGQTIRNLVLHYEKNQPHKIIYGPVTHGAKSSSVMYFYAEYSRDSPSQQRKLVDNNDHGFVPKSKHMVQTGPDEAIV